MGRKSDKGKEKRQRRKDETAKYQVKQALVDIANTLEDPMATLLPFKKFDRNGLSVTISCSRVEDLDEEVVNWAYELTRANMKTLYEQSDWGWNDKQKRAELSEDKARYLVARDQDNKPVAVVHFRFDMEFEEAVLYCYEIQLEKEVRRKGLGKFLMQILELLAHKNEMSKVMVTVFKQNPAAHNFFAKTLKYQPDMTSPEESMEEALYDEEGYTYEIMSKKIGLPKADTHAHSSANGCGCGHSHASNGHASVTTDTVH